MARPRERAVAHPGWRRRGRAISVAPVKDAAAWSTRTRVADFVAEVFCPSECVRLIQDQASMRNVDSRIHSLRFDCCVFLFYSFSAVTFATKSAKTRLMQCSKSDLLFDHLVGELLKMQRHLEAQLF